MKWFIISQNSGIQGTTRTWTDLESLDSHSTIGDYVMFVDESGDANLDPIDPRFPMLNLVFCLIRKDHYIDFVVPQLHRLKMDFSVTPISSSTNPRCVVRREHLQSSPMETSIHAGCGGYWLGLNGPTLQSSALALTKSPLLDGTRTLSTPMTLRSAFV